ncbi:MAG: hypothetical protein HQM08_18655 [Candidatus Riflebacteria bacterium]|nr:hypothetical protein [Candidatus Riflebacteria bacterium]
MFRNSEKTFNRALFAPFLFCFFFLLSSMVFAETEKNREKSLNKSSGKKKDESSSDKKGKKKDSKDSKDKKKSEKNEEDDSLFLKEKQESQEYLPDIFRCPECGYEQDEPGNCPDHDETVLIMVKSKGKNPLEPPEVDGNEDLITDVPIADLAFKRAVSPENASPTPKIDQPNKSDQKNKKSGDSNKDLSNKSDQSNKLDQKSDQSKITK